MSALSARLSNQRASQVRGGIEAGGDIQAHNLVTGVQVNHIVNVYRAGGGSWSQADYQAALERYLEWLSAAMGRVVLSGIERGGRRRSSCRCRRSTCPWPPRLYPKRGLN